MIRRTSKIALEFVAGVLLSLLIGGGIIVWLVSQGPVSLSFVRGPLESLISAGLPGVSVRMKDAIIERGEQVAGLRFRLRDLTLLDRDGKLVAGAPRATFGISWKALFDGRLVPSRLALIGPRVILRRRADGTMELGVGGANPASPAGASGDTGPPNPLAPSQAKGQVATQAPAETGDAETQENGGQGPSAMESATNAGSALIGFIFDNLSAPAGRGGAASFLEDISIRDAALTLHDEANDAVWQAPAANLVFQRVPEGVSLLTDARIGSGASAMNLQLSAIYRSKPQTISVTARVNQFIPAEVAKKMPVLSTFAQVRLPLDGEVRVELERSGKVLAAGAAMSLGAGYVDFPGFLAQPILIDEGALRVNYEPESGDVVISDSLLYIGGGQASLSGRFSPTRDGEGKLQTVRYNLASKSLAADGPGAQPLAIDAVILEGKADLKDSRLDIDSLYVGSGQARVLVTGYLRDEGIAPAIRLNGKMSRIPISLMKRLWPPAAVPGAREWMIENVHDGTVSSGELVVDISSFALADALNGSALPDEQVDLSFTLENVEADFLGDLPHIKNARGSGRIRGNSFEVRMEEGFVTPKDGAPLKMTNGLFSVPELAPKGPPSTISFDLTGATASVLRTIDYPPLGYTSKFGLSPANVSGNSTSHFEIAMPLLKDLELDDVTLTVKSKLTEVTLPNVFGDADIDGGSLELDITKERAIASGEVKINGVPARMKWSEDFTGASARPSTFELSGTADDWGRKRLGLDLSRFISGPVPFTVKAAGRGPKIETASVTADISAANFYFRPTGWIKPAGQKARAELEVDFPGDGRKVFRKFRTRGQGIDIDGTLTLDKNDDLERLKFNRVTLGANALAVSGARRKDGVLTIKVDATDFDARPLVRSMFKSSTVEEPPKSDKPQSRRAVEVRASLARAYGFNNAQLFNISTTMRMVDGEVQAMSMNSNFADRSPLEVTISGGARGGRTLRARTKNGGELLRLMDIYSRVRGGDFKLDAQLSAPGQKTSNGNITMTSFVVSNERTLQNVARSTRGRGGQQAAGNKGLSEIAFTSLRVPYRRSGDTLQIDDAFLKGPTMGATARGTINTANSRLDIGGTFIPAYELNSFISNVPILGEVLLGGRGQGVFGVTFAVGGTLEQPRFTVNPVSALAPGILRKLFEIGGRKPLTTGESFNSRDGTER